MTEKTGSVQEMSVSDVKAKTDLYSPFFPLAPLAPWDQLENFWVGVIVHGTTVNSLTIQCLMYNVSRA